MSTSLVVRNTSLLHRAKFFYNKYSRDQYPWSSKYPWIIGSNHQNEIQSLIYVLHGTFRMLSFLNLIQINPYSGVAALRTETYTKILSLCAQEYNNGVSSADHMVYEENRPNYGYGKISFPSNVGGVNDSLFQSPAYKALKSKQYNQILPIYAGGGVSTNMDHIISSINAECKLRSFKEKLHGKTMCMYAFAVDNWLHPSSKGIRKHTQEIKNQLLVSNDIVVSSIYRLPFDCTELGSLQAIVTCLTTFQYNDFLPNGSAKVCFT